MSKVEKQKRRIIVKIIRKSEHGGKKGIWKVAYADFVTAMMAFFLLLWLITVSSKNDLMGVGEYFSKPVRIAFLGGKTDDEDTSIIGQGGKDLTRTSGDVARTADLATAQKEMQRLEAESLQQLKTRIEKAMEADPAMLDFRHQLLIDITANGLRIQIVDDKNRPMFDRGSAILQPYAIEILHAIGKMLNTVTNRISLSGHTDATPYQGGARNYNNWDLSVDRANASRRALIEGGMDAGKVLRVIGLASAIPLDRNNAFDPINRRISIIVMKQEAAKSAASN